MWRLAQKKIDQQKETVCYELPGSGPLCCKRYSANSSAAQAVPGANCILRRRRLRCALAEPTGSELGHGPFVPSERRSTPRGDEPRPLSRGKRGCKGTTTEDGSVTGRMQKSTHHRGHSSPWKRISCVARVRKRRTDESCGSNRTDSLDVTATVAILM